MDATQLDYALTSPHPPQSSQYSQRTMVKNHDRQVLFSLSTISSQLEANPFDPMRNFGPLSVAEHTEASYPYPRPCDIALSPDQHQSPFTQSQEAPLADITPYIYDSGSSSYPPNPQPSQSSYHGHEAFHLSLDQDLNAQSLSLSINSSLGLAIQTPPTPFSSAPSTYSAVRRYHEEQSRQHAQVLQQLARSRDGRRQSPTEHLTGNGLSTSLEITPTGRRAEFYHAASSIPMSNIRLHQARPPEHSNHQLQHSQQSKSFNQYQFPYYHNQDLPYPENCRPELLDLSNTHVLTTQGIRIHESVQQEATSTFHVSTKTMHISTPSTTNPATIALESNTFTMRTGSCSNATQSVPQPRTHSFEGVTAPSKVHPSTNPSDMASITSPFPVLTEGADCENGPSGIAEKGSHLIEIETESGGEEKLTIEGGLSKEDVAEHVVGYLTSTSTKRRDRKQSGEYCPTGKLRTGDFKNDSVIKDGLSPPTKKRKKSKMHECQVCHKSFPRPSGLKTHMNTHNNERPYPCPYPGCNRTFGVRSNAKRHLRTHGVIPPQNTGTQPYVVDFSTPMVLEQDGRLGLNGGGVDSTTTRNDDERSGNAAHTQRPARPGRGRGRQFKLRWMPPSSSNRSAVAKGKAKKKSTDSSLVEMVELQDLDVKPSLSRSPSQENVYLDHGEEDLEGEDTDARTDGEEDAEDFGDEGDEESEAEEVDRSEEEFGTSTAMQSGVVGIRSGSSHHSQASSSRSSLSSSLSASASTSTASTSTLSHHLSASSSSSSSVSPIPAQKTSCTLVVANFS